MSLSMIDRNGAGHRCVTGQIRVHPLLRNYFGPSYVDEHHTIKVPP